MSARVEVSVAGAGVAADADAYETADVDTVPVRSDRIVADPGATANPPTPVSHGAHPQAAAPVQVQLAQATNTYDETAEARRENDERLEEVHAAEAETAEQQRADAQKQ